MKTIIYFIVQNMSPPPPPRTKLSDYVTEKVNNFILLDDASKIGILTSHINVIRKTANYIKLF